MGEFKWVRGLGRRGCAPHNHTDRADAPTECAAGRAPVQA